MRYRDRNFINRDLSKLSSWFSTNRLTLNVSKSKFILIGSPKKLSTCNDVNVVIDDSPLECTDTFKYLGVTINKTMTWGDHVEAISTKINQRLGLLKRIIYCHLKRGLLCTTAWCARCSIMAILSGVIRAMLLL